MPEKAKCPVFRAFNKSGRVQNVYCGQWSCERCSKVKARLWAWRTRITINDSTETWYFWTLTMRRKYRDANVAYADLPRLWDTLRKTIQRRSGRFSYIAFVEGQPKRGDMPHFHVICNVKPWKRVKDIAMYAGFGYQAKADVVNGPKAASYVAKYATKQNPATPKGFRRVRTSQDIKPLPERETEGLIVPRRHESTVEYVLRVASITDLDPDTIYERWIDSQEPSDTAE